MACTFRLADACTTSATQHEPAPCSSTCRRNNVGLLAEEYESTPTDSSATPQSFSMVGLITTARNLSGTPTSAPGRHQRLRQTPSPLPPGVR